MASNRSLIILILIALPAFWQSGFAQDQQDAFDTNLIAACRETDFSKLESLILNHRLQVKPVVNRLIGEYITRLMTGRRAAAVASKVNADLIAQKFKEIHGEESLVIATGYLDQWTMEQLGKKAQADRIYGLATDLRKSGGQNEEAILRFGQALELYRDIGDVRGEGEVLGGLGFIYWSTSADSCMSYYRQALIARERADDWVLTGATLNSIGLVHFQHYGDLDSAGHYIHLAADLREKTGDLKGLGSSLGYLSMIYEYQGKLEAAIVCYERSFMVYEKLGNPAEMANAKFRAGSNLQQLGKYPRALQDLESAKDIFTSLGDSTAMADVYSQMALVHENIGDYDPAIAYVNIASNLYQELGDSWGLAGVYNHTGIILQSAGRKEKASSYYQKSLKIYEETDDQENVVTVLSNLGGVTFELNDFDEAESYQQRGLEITRKLEFKAGELPCLINLANTQNRLNLLDEAMENYKLAQILCSELNSPDNEWKIMVGIAENYKLREDYPKAIEYNEKGLSIIEGLRSTLQSQANRSSYLARERFAFEDVIHMLVEQHESDPGKGYDLLAFEYAQRCKSRSFLEQMEGSDPVTLKEVQDGGLNENSVILEYALGDSSSVLWIITPDAYRMIRLPDRKTLEQQVETFRFAILHPEQDNRAFLQQAGYKLYDQLILPAESYISKKNQVVILPDGVLHYIPFEVLITREAKKGADKPYSKLPYLGKTVALSYGQSASVYLHMLAHRSTSAGEVLALKELVGFGNPLYDDKYKDLELSGKEVESIATLFPSEGVSTFLRSEASEENAKKDKLLSEYRYIHFATHGIVDEKNPERSGLVLSQENLITEDGILRAGEISGLELNAELVVLSACQTGIGKMIRGEGMIGLSRSFMYAGAHSVIMSLWSVNDRSSSILMESFYKYLVQDGLSLADALHQARISMIKDDQYAHPFYWAPFVLTGDWQ